jgi:ABC-2 type transport system permease protein
MAGLAPDPIADMEAGVLSSRQFFRTIVWLRWRIFANGLRSKGATGELIVTILSYPILALIVLGPSFGAGFTAWYLVKRGMDFYLAIPLWIIFAIWQIVGASTSASGPSFSLDSLVRFPIRYRDYLMMRLSFGLMDPPTLAGIGCLLAMTLGAGIAAPALLPCAALALFTYALCNLFFSRMIYTWLERWLAQRRTREMVTALILIGSLGIQIASQFVSRFTAGTHHAPPSPWMLSTAHLLLAVNWILPPGLTASTVAHGHAGSIAIATLAYAGLLAYTAAFLFILHLRLHAQYRGESLSEAPAAGKKPTFRKFSGDASTAAKAPSRRPILSPLLESLLLKELKLLQRSGPRLYALVMPVFIIYLFSFRTAGLAQAGFSDQHFTNYIFAYGCAYTLLIFTNFLYNALGSDGSGVQFYFLAPLRIRDVMLAKNLLMTILLMLEIALIYGATLSLHIHTPPALAAATLTWTAFTFLINLAIGNLRSMIAPKGVDPSKVRRQNVSAVSSFLSIGIILVSGVLGQSAIFLCQIFHTTLWAAAAAFLVLTVLAFLLYTLTLRRMDRVAFDHVETLVRELSKA